MCYKIASKTKISATTVKFWPKSPKIPLISEKTQANPKKTQGIWLKTQCTRGKSLLHPLKKRENKKPDIYAKDTKKYVAEIGLFLSFGRLFHVDLPQNYKRT